MISKREARVRAAVNHFAHTWLPVIILVGSVLILAGIPQ